MNQNEPNEYQPLAVKSGLTVNNTLAGSSTIYWIDCNGTTAYGPTSNLSRVLEEVGHCGAAIKVNDGTGVQSMYEWDTSRKSWVRRKTFLTE